MASNHDNQHQDNVRNDPVANAQKLATEYLGISLKLFDALELNKHSSISEIAVQCSLDYAYTARWLDAAVAAGLVSREGGNWIVTHYKGRQAGPERDSRVASVMQSIYSILIADAAIPLFRSGERPGYSIVTKFENVVPYYGLIGSALFSQRFLHEVMPIILANPISRKTSGVVADYWGGNGYLLKLLVDELQTWKGNVVGLPKPEEMLGGIGYISDEEFRRAEGKTDLIIASRVMHHFGLAMEDTLKCFHKALRNGGALYIWEFAWPDTSRGETLETAGDLPFLNLIEHIQGNHFLTRLTIESALRNAGFETTRHDLQAGREVLFEARKLTP